MKLTRYGTTAFNAISVIVHDGVVRLGGYAYSSRTTSKEVPC